MSSRSTSKYALYSFVKKVTGGTMISVTNASLHEIDSMRVMDPTIIIVVRRKTFTLLEIMVEITLQSAVRRESISPVWPKFRIY